MQQIDKEFRSAVLSVIQRLAYYHPALKSSPCTRVPECWVCRDVGKVLALLEAEQCEYGPPIDESDPSYQRMKASQ